MTRALLILDTTHDIGRPDGRFGQMGGAAHARSRGVPERLVRAAAAARAAGDVVAWSVPSAELFERNGMPASDEWGGALDEDFGTPGPDELVVEKPQVDAFDGTDLEAHLRKHDVDEVVLTGISTTYVVTATAHGALARGFRTLVAEDGCAAGSDEEHASALAALPDDVAVVALGDVWPG